LVTYETIFIVRPDLSQEEVDSTLEFFKGNIEQHGGEILKVEPWGKLTMAYEIEDYREGFYFLIQYTASGNYNDELEKRYRYNEDVLRFSIVKIDEKKFKLKPRKDPAPRPDRKGRKPVNPRKPKDDKPHTEDSEDSVPEAVSDEESE
jgi:small subunit ribosomal protein S6